MLFLLFLFCFLFNFLIVSGLVGRPINSITNGFAIPAEDWEWPEPSVHAEDLFHVTSETNVEHTFPGLTFVLGMSFEILNCGLIVNCELIVEL